jgi:hypothetical protein
MRRALLLMLLVTLFAQPLGAREPPVRSLSPDMTDLMQRASARSPTVAALLKAVEATDVILQVDFHFGNLVPRAVTQMTGAGGATRYIRLVINARLPARVQMELLGHELHHVMEIAAHPEVRDQKGMRALFETLGWRDGLDGSYETTAAVMVERQVRAELRKS